MHYKSNIKIRKATGEIVDFSLEKLENSLKHSGASPAEIKKIISYILDNIYDNITSGEIYKMSFEKLRDIRSVYASRYKLKKAIYEMGPSGFPFERLVATILKEEGYQTEIGVILQGNCVDHEVDVLAQKDGIYFPVECKFHSDEKYICNIKIPLYIHSRYNDIIENPKQSTNFGRIWIVTNTRFSDDAIKYAACHNIKLLSWSFPKGNGLKDKINRLGLHPLTSLNLLSDEEKDKLLAEGIVLCRELAENDYLINKIGISKNRKKRILDEIKELVSMDYIISDKQSDGENNYD